MYLPPMDQSNCSIRDSNSKLAENKTYTAHLLTKLYFFCTQQS